MVRKISNYLHTQVAFKEEGGRGRGMIIAYKIEWMGNK
jgi:hypothetical protein